MHDARVGKSFVRKPIHVSLPAWHVVFLLRLVIGGIEIVNKFELTIIPFDVLL